MDVPLFYQPPVPRHVPIQPKSAEEIIAEGTAREAQRKREQGKTKAAAAGAAAMRCLPLTRAPKRIIPDGSVLQAWASMSNTAGPLTEGQKELQKLTTENTERNTAYGCVIERTEAFVDLPRPPSPTSRVRTKAQKAREVERQSRNERAQRRSAAKDGEGDSSIASTSAEERRLAPGDEFEWTEPERRRKGRHVRWAQSLVHDDNAGVGPQTPEHSAAGGVGRRCLARTYELDRHGNTLDPPPATEPLRVMVRETRLFLTMSPPEEESAELAATTTEAASPPTATAAATGPGPRRTKLSWAQLVRLESIFAQTWYPSWAEKDTLAREFDLEHQQINVWFCNRRTKAKREKETMPDSFIPSHAQAALKSKRARPSEPPIDSLGSTTMTREPTPEPAPSSRASSTTPDPRPIALPPIRTSPPLAPAPAPVSASSAASIQAKLSSSLSAALLGSATSTAYRAPYVSQPPSQNRSRDRSLSPGPRTRRHRSNSAASPRHSPHRQYTYPFTHQRSHSGSPPAPTLAPIGRPDYPHALPPFHKTGPHSSLPAALPAPPTTKPHELYQRYPAGDHLRGPFVRSPLLAHRAPDSQVASPTHSPIDHEHRKLLAQQQHIQAIPHVGALQVAPHMGAFPTMPVVGVFQGTAPPPAELPISVWQAHPLVRTRARITREQLRALEALFAKTWFPTSQQRAEAANATGMREYSVTVWFQNRRSKAKKEGISPPEGDRAKLRKDKGPKRDLGTHVFEVGSSRHPEPMATGAPAYAPSGSADSHPPMAEHNLVWLEDARSRGRAPVMKAAGSHSPRITDNKPERSRSPRSRSWSGAEPEPESDLEMESESESRTSRPHYQPGGEPRGTNALSSKGSPSVLCQRWSPSNATPVIVFIIWRGYSQAKFWPQSHWVRRGHIRAYSTRD
ncbi:hypothetical protein BN14_02196 [Rhizoctonia solani AG-1 IB]|uniref:Homeobox domain-containing protein n=1 Tax=Thanatephorus cucumeris (strain AG1-IB / isolate 7/3/14) TaxID=1108050 RepID=M5BL96_THACB|nr:hypothetical protein BN14_02196 [Rhizoctonia solani AG-1 IB]